MLSCLQQSVSITRILTALPSITLLKRILNYPFNCITSLVALLMFFLANLSFWNQPPSFCNTIWSDIHSYCESGVKLTGLLMTTLGFISKLDFICVLLVFYSNACIWTGIFTLVLIGYCFVWKRDFKLLQMLNQIFIKLSPRF